MPRQTRRSIYKTPPSTTPKTRSKKTKEKIEEEKTENIDEINQEEENNDENEKQIEKTVEQDSSSDDDDDEDQKDETEISKNIQQITENEEETFVIDSNPCQNVQKNEESENEVPNDIDSSENDSSSDDEDDKLQEKNLNISKKSDSDDESENEDISEEQLFCISTKPTLDNNSQSENNSEIPNNNKKRKKQQEKEGRKYPKYNEAMEQSYEKFLFGNSFPKSKIDESSSDSSSDESDIEDVGPVHKITAQVDSDSDSTDSDDSTKPSKGLKPAWQDEDDKHIQVKDVAATFSKAKGKHGQKDTSTENYAKSLRKKFTSFMDTPSWADLKGFKSKDEEDSDDEFFRETTDMLATKAHLQSLKKGHIEYRKLKDMNHTTHNEGNVIRAAEFHPSAAVGLVAGLNGTASLFQIDGKNNPKMQSVHFENFPIKTAHFTSNGRQFLVGSQHFGHFYAYDMVKGQTIRVPWKEDSARGSVQKFEVNPVNDLVAFQGKYGQIHLMSSRSRSKLFTLKMNDEVSALTFSPDGEFLYSHGFGGEVYIWDIKNQECVHKFVDDGCVKGSSIAISRNNQYLSCGSDSGVVNIYKRKTCWSSTNPNPEKIVLNLTTSVTDLKFNPSSEILAMASEVKENSVKLLHVPSMTVFSNFPSFNFNVKRPNCIDFSLNGGYFSVGNNRGAANLYRMKHFGNY